ncbi:11846_t:CDS:2, partial [Entrophospora sp. SA101]
MEEALTKPRNVTHTLYKLYNWLQMEIIDLNPEFQRDVVWTAIKQSHLIDSILNNFYVPPIIFSCKKLDNKKWIRVCIDGKQRLTAIRKYMDNEIPHSSPSDGNISKKFYKNTNGKKALSEAERELFDCSELLCVEYYDLSLQQEQEIFSRAEAMLEGVEESRKKSHDESSTTPTRNNNNDINNGVLYDVAGNVKFGEFRAYDEFEK